MNISTFKIEDQYAEDAEWSKFNSIPSIFVMAGEKASEDAKKWGIWLHEHYNGNYLPSKDHLRSLDPRENVKVIAVATLPAVPFIFKGLFRRGFKSKTAMGVLLDYEAKLSSQFHYQESFVEAGLALCAPDAKNFDEAKIFIGPSSNEELRSQILNEIKKFQKL